MKKLSVLLLGVFALAACSDAEEQVLPATFESSKTRVAAADIPASHKTYIRKVFREALPASVTDAQVDDMVEGYLVEYVHHIGVGYITENFHLHGLYPAVSCGPVRTKSML